MKKLLKNITLLIILIFTYSAQAKPSKSIKAMMDTPVSAFDFFLYQLYDSTKCDKWYGYQQFTPPNCMTKQPEYDEENDSLILYFRISLRTNDDYDIKYSEKFQSASEEERMKMLQSDFDHFLYQFGLEKKPKKNWNKMGLNHPKGWIDRQLFPKKLKSRFDNVKDRMILNINFSYYKGPHYNAKRDIEGTVIIRKFDLESTILPLSSNNSQEN